MGRVHRAKNPTTGWDVERNGTSVRVTDASGTVRWSVDAGSEAEACEAYESAIRPFGER